MTDYKNDRIKELILNDVFPEDKPGSHKFSMDSDTCSQCNKRFWDWAGKPNNNGVFNLGMRLCPVIGLDEMRSWGSDIIRGDDGGY